MSIDALLADAAAFCTFVADFVSRLASVADLFWPILLMAHAVNTLDPGFDDDVCAFVSENVSGPEEDILRSLSSFSAGFGDVFKLGDDCVFDFLDLVNRQYSVLPLCACMEVCNRALLA